jgi:DNA-binding GntR family transcriptional regulator
MSRLSSSFELNIAERDSKVPAYRWLYAALRDEIVNGRLRPGARLPATRELAKQYGLARGTIMNSFDQLKAEGYLDAGVGSGTYVSSIIPDELLEVGAKGGTKPKAIETAQQGRRLMPSEWISFRISKCAPAVRSAQTCLLWISFRPRYGRKSHPAACGVSL